MTWGKVSDRLHAHSKARRAREAMALWVLALSWSCDELTDGAIPADMPELLIPGGDAMAEKLVSVGLWERTESGYQFHDWEEFQPSADLERDRRESVSRVRSEAGKRGNAKRWGERSQTDRNIVATASQTDRKTIANGSQNDRPVPVPVPKNPLPNPLPQAEGGSDGSPSASGTSERATIAASCSTVEQLGTDPHEVALSLGASVPRLRHFPGGMRDDFRRVASPLRIEWPVLAAWFSAGGTRRHRSGRVTWAWLIGHGGAPLAECWALAQEWASKGRPSLDERGEIAAPKPAPEAAKPAPLRVVPAPLAWLEGAPERISPEAIERAKAKARVKVANGR